MATTRERILLIFVAFRLSHGNRTNIATTTISGSPNSSTGNEFLQGQTTAKFLEDFCISDVITNDDVRRKCCSFVYNDFSRVWFRRGYYLTDFLTEIRRMNCSDFKKECAEPTYDFNWFTTLAYKRFCEPQELVNVCSDELADLLAEHNEDITSGDNEYVTSIEKWKSIAESLEPEKLWLRQVTKPCVQVAMFDNSRFTEIIQPFAPFCAMTWTGYDVETAIRHRVSPWTSMSPRCRGSTIISIIVILLLGVAIAVSNLIIIAVYGSTPKLRNSQAIYKMSIAIGDLLVGLVVIPSEIYFQHFLVFKHLPEIDKMNPNRAVSYLEKILQRDHLNQVHLTLSRPLMNTVGFLTTFSVAVSVFTLLGASFDRFWAVFRPLKYNKVKAKRNAKIYCVFIWVIAIGNALVPIVTPGMEYVLVASILVTSEGPYALVQTSLSFIIPLLILWVITIATYRMAKKHARARKKISSALDTDNRLEIRLARTLSLMILVFSGCVVPVLISVLMAVFLNFVYFTFPQYLKPESAMIYNSFEFCAGLVLLSNSLWNCLIYSVRTKEFRTGVKRVYENVKSRACVRYLSQGARYIIYNARRVSQSSLNTLRKTSSGGINDIRKPSAGSIGTVLTNANASGQDILQLQTTSVFSSSERTAVGQTQYSKNSSDIYTKVSKVKGRKTSLDDTSITEDSVFRSFAPDSGADHFFVSVMEKIEESDGE